MRKVNLNRNDFSNNLYLSVFVGTCNTKALLDEYLEQHWERLDLGLASSQFGEDFNIEYYEDDFLVYGIHSQMSNDIDEVFGDVKAFDLNLLKRDYPGHLDRDYNVAIIVGRLKYEGELQEIQNDKFGYFKFLGTYPELLPDKIRDDPGMDKYAVSKLCDWGYRISVSTENRDELKEDYYFKNHFVWKAKKDGKTYTARDPVRLLGIVTIVKEYGDAWDRIDIPDIFSLNFEHEG